MQDDLRALFSQYDPSLTAGGKTAHVTELCRLVTVISQAREDIVYPWCASRTPAPLFHDSMIRMDLARVLVAELVSGSPSGLWYDPLVQVLATDLEALWDGEESGTGLWASITSIADRAEVNTRLAERLEALDRSTRRTAWRPLEPTGLETLRDSLPPVAWTR